jgi:uncharacterized Zn-binding protein involved in type VI secretion
MQPVARVGDAESHNCHIVSTPQGWVFIDGKAVATVGSGVCCGIYSEPHPSPGKITSGSSLWFIDGKPVGRLGDPTQHTRCGSGVITGACDWVFSD